MDNKINKSHFIVIVAALCLLISGCLGGGTMSDLPESDLPNCETIAPWGVSQWTNCQGIYSEGGNQYVGEFKDGVFHGQGTMTYANGDQYVGEWKDNMPHGQGTVTWKDGEQYVGEWKNNMPHGQGTITLSNGNQYVGEFKDGLMHGQGTLTFPDGRQLEGIWEEGVFLYENKGK